MRNTRGWAEEPVRERLARFLSDGMAEHDYCPHCGAAVPEHAQACPECGSCGETGWSEAAKYDRIGVDYEESFDYEEFVRGEFGEKRRGSRLPRWGWILVAVLLAVLLTAIALRFG